MSFVRSLKAISQRINVTKVANLNRASFKVYNPTRLAPVSLRAYSTDAGLSTNDIQSRIFKVLESYEKIDAKSITPEAHFTKDLKLDSLDNVEVVMAIEEEFSIEIPDHDADEIRSVQDAIKYVSSRKDAQ
ncbi:acyl carrier protein [Neoconidiobolus thromboides FSU 785]|nr:acyl carrier protein [Neoconidiobolus thromboides FSU 785]